MATTGGTSDMDDFEKELDSYIQAEEKHKSEKQVNFDYKNTMFMFY